VSARAWRCVLVAGAVAWAAACSPARQELPLPPPAAFDAGPETDRTYHLWPRTPAVVELRCRVDDPLLRNPHFDRRAVKVRWTGGSEMRIGGDDMPLTVMVLGTQIETREYPVWLRRDGTVLEIRGRSEEEIGGMRLEQARSKTGIDPSSVSGRRTLERHFIRTRLGIFWSGKFSVQSQGWLRVFPALDAAVPVRASSLGWTARVAEAMLHVTVPWDRACDPVRGRRPR